MVDIMNELDVDCAVYGNHEFDFGIGPLQAGLTGRQHAYILQFNSYYPSAEPNFQGCNEKNEFSMALFESKGY